MSVPTLFRLARALGCPTADLVTLDAEIDAEPTTEAARAPDEVELLPLWRVAPDDVRDALLRLLRAAVKV